MTPAWRWTTPSSRKARWACTYGGGRYACARFTGTGADIHAAWMRLCGEWLPQSGWQADDKPALELYEEDFVMDPKTGAFSCLLCVPVRPL